MHGVDYDSDHVPVVGAMKIKIKKKAGREQKRHQCQCQKHIQCNGAIGRGRRKVADGEREHVRICKRTHSCHKTKEDKKLDDSTKF